MFLHGSCIYMFGTYLRELFVLKVLANMHDEA